MNIVLTVLALICYSIIWYYTKLGVEKDFGSFFSIAFATAIVGFLLVTLKSYIEKRANKFLVMYVVTALIASFIAFNFWYPRQRAVELVADELTAHNSNFDSLRSAVLQQFSDPGAIQLQEKVRGLSKQLQDEIRDYGFGRRANEILSAIEELLQQKIRRSTPGKDKEEWDEIASNYAIYVEDALKLAINSRSNTTSEKIKLTNDITSQNNFYSQKIESSLKDRKSLHLLPNYVVDLVDDYRKYCKEAKRIAALEIPKKSFAECSDDYASPNANMGKFSHTYPSAWNSISNMDTIFAAGMSILFEFIFPLFLLFLTSSSAISTGGYGPFRPKNPKEQAPRIFN